MVYSLRLIHRLTRTRADWLRRGVFPEASNTLLPPGG